MVLGQGRLKVVPGGEWFVEEVAHGTVLAVDLFGGGIGRGMGAPGFGRGELLQGGGGDLPLAAPEHLIQGQAADSGSQRHLLRALHHLKGILRITNGGAVLHKEARYPHVWLDGIGTRAHAQIRIEGNADPLHPHIRIELRRAAPLLGVLRPRQADRIVARDVALAAESHEALCDLDHRVWFVRPQT